MRGVLASGFSNCEFFGWIKFGERRGMIALNRLNESVFADC